MSKIEIHILVSIWPCNSRSVTAAKVSICRVDTGTTFHLPLHIEIAISPFSKSLHKNLAAMLDWLQFLIITWSHRFQILQSYRDGKHNKNSRDKFLAQKISTKTYPKNDPKLPKMAQKWPKMAQKLAPAKKIAEIYLQYLQLFASLLWCSVSIEIFI